MFFKQCDDILSGNIKRVWPFQNERHLIYSEDFVCYEVERRCLWEHTHTDNRPPRNHLMHCNSLSIISFFSYLYLWFFVAVYFCQRFEKEVSNTLLVLDNVNPNAKCIFFLNVFGSAFLPCIFPVGWSSQEPTHVTCWSEWRLKSTGLKSNFFVWALNQSGQRKDINHQG